MCSIPTGQKDIPEPMLIGVVLAGGQSSRMGQNKALLLRPQQNTLETELHSVSMLAFTCSQLVEAGASELVISGNKDDYPDTLIRQLAMYCGKPLRRVSDDLPQLGPIGGISSVLFTCNSPARCLFVPVDLPLLKACELEQLILSGEQHQSAAHFVRQPLPLFVYDIAIALSKVTQQIDSNKLSIHQFASAMSAMPVNNPSASNWINSNTPQEWQQALDLI